ncbi:MAG TPA: hypothetical protein VJU16_03550 [Planctomycetota bacterium]|nr:hypothetical protein [Planctomycetota bacterium]
MLQVAEEVEGKRLILRWFGLPYYVGTRVGCSVFLLGLVGLIVLCLRLPFPGWLIAPLFFLPWIAIAVIGASMLLPHVSFFAVDARLREMVVRWGGLRIWFRRSRRWDFGDLETVSFEVSKDQIERWEVVGRFRARGEELTLPLKVREITRRDDAVYFMIFVGRILGRNRCTVSRNDPRRLHVALVTDAPDSTHRPLEDLKNLEAIKVDLPVRPEEINKVCVPYRIVEWNLGVRVRIERTPVGPWGLAFVFAFGAVLGYVGGQQLLGDRLQGNELYIYPGGLGLALG